MKAEDKDLLLKDLCARFPYGLKGKCEIDASYDTSFDTIYQLHKFDAILEGIKGDLLFVTPLIEDKDEQEFANEEVAEGIDILDFKPYLRQMSSMTEEEKEEYDSFLFDNLEREDVIGYEDKAFGIDVIMRYRSLDVVQWLLEHHFDFNGLIDVHNLALEAPKDMYKI